MAEEHYFGVKGGAHVIDGKLYKEGDVVKLTEDGYKRRGGEAFGEPTSARRIKYTKEVRPTE